MFMCMSVYKMGSVIVANVKVSTFEPVLIKTSKLAALSVLQYKRPCKISMAARNVSMSPLFSLPLGRRKTKYCIEHLLLANTAHVEAVCLVFHVHQTC